MIFFLVMRLSLTWLSGQLALSSLLEICRSALKIWPKADWPRRVWPRGGGGNGIDVFFSPQDSDSYRGSMLGFMLSGVYAGIIGRFFWVLKFEWCNGVVKDGSLWSL